MPMQKPIGPEPPNMERALRLESSSSTLFVIKAIPLGILHAAARPWRARKTNKTYWLGDTALIKEVRANRAIPVKKMDRYPYISPSLPAGIRKAAKAMAYEAINHGKVEVVRPRSSAIVGIATLTADKFMISKQLEKQAVIRVTIFVTLEVCDPKTGSRNIRAMTFPFFGTINCDR
jgi:hypothetical protein